MFTDAQYAEYSDLELIAILDDIDIDEVEELEQYDTKQKLKQIRRELDIRAKEREMNQLLGRLESVNTGWWKWFTSEDNEKD